MSDVRVTEDSAEFLTVEADGGDRRERAGAISGVLRGRGKLTHLRTNYDEAYGFQTRTTIRYRKGA